MEFGEYVESPQIIIKFIMPTSDINYEIIANLLQGFCGELFVCFNKALNELLN